MRKATSFRTNHLTSEIKLSANGEHVFEVEVVFDCHLLVWFISGETRIVLDDKVHVFGTNDLFLIPRNRTVRVVNQPKDGLPHKCVVMYLTEKKLRDYYQKYPAVVKKQPLREIRVYKNHPLLESCLASLLPYFQLTSGLPTIVADLKIEEAISILRSIDRAIDSLLTNFDPPGKINLELFMENNYRFHLSLAQFSYLTGRSLATFRRDFRAIFHMNPQKWLTERRLNFAHYQIQTRGQRPVDVYFEAGFENLSHFSYAFKKFYGYSPSTLLVPTER